MKEGIVLILIVCLAMIGGALLGIIIYDIVNPITPMDVYQDKTTLKYTIIDGVKVDSTVIWKEE